MPNVRHADNIIEAMRLFVPDHPLINSLDKNGYATRNTQYIPVIVPDGKIMGIKTGNPTSFYRGERKNRSSCKAGLFRIADRERKIIDLLKTYQFMDFLKRYPTVKDWEDNNYHVDYWMLAQHYEFKTPLLDLTDEIAVAAFFATHRYDSVTKSYEVQEDGQGVIRQYKGKLDIYGDLKPVGRQPLGRPSQQDGVALWLDDSVDFVDISDAVVFDQNKEINLRLKRAMLGGTDYFPPEPVSMMAMRIRESNLIKSSAIEDMLKDADAGKKYIDPKPTRAEIEKIIRDNNLHIVDADIMAPQLPPPDPQLRKMRWVVTRPVWRR